MSFVEGDIVKHRASKKCAVVVHVFEKCAEHQINFECMANKFECQYKPTGYLKVKTDFGDEFVVHHSEVVLA